MASRSHLGSALTLLIFTACGGDGQPSQEKSSGGAASQGGATSGGTLASGGSAAGGATGGSDSLATCYSSDISRKVKFRLEAESGAPAVPELAVPQDVDVAGQLTDIALSSEPCTTCDSGLEPTLRLSLTATDGPVWVLVLKPEGALEQWGLSAQASVGEEVSLRVRYRRSFQSPASSGFVLSDAAGIVMAVEAGPWVKTLLAYDLPGLEISQGTEVCRDLSSICGNVILSELIFHGDTSASVGFASDEQFALAGHDYIARNSGGGHLRQGGCSDAEHTWTWSIRREP